MNQLTEAQMDKAGVRSQEGAVLEVLPLPFEPLAALQPSIGSDEEDLANCRGKRIGILIVTYNAVTTLTNVLKRITPQVWENIEEIAVFDDASQDSTYELVLGLKSLRALPKLTVVKHTKNLGYGGNQKAGYAYFIEKGFDVVVLLHGDGQYAPEILSHIYAPLVRGEADAVFGSRMMKTYGGPLKGGMPLYKYIGNRILSVFENSALGLNLTEFHSGYRGYNLHALRKIDFTHMTDDFHFDTEIIIKLGHQHYRIHEVPIPTYYGSEICYVNGMRYAKDVFRAVRRYRSTKNSVVCHPEFQEYFVRYPVKHSKYSSHDYVRQLTGTGKSILDLGCGQGGVAAELKKSGNAMTGVDVFPENPKPEIFEAYLQADLNQGLRPALAQTDERRWELVLLLDILEHLRDPDAVLRQCRDVLTENGQVIISVPNIANLTVRMMLLFGRFEYSERGILDRTHTRFFTRKTARRFVKQNGFEIVKERITIIPLELVFGWPPEKWLGRMMSRLMAGITAILPGLFGYQIMFVARPRRNLAQE